jgi:hypothetical protein
MRDDIHKSAPVPNQWRRLMRQCAREADRGARTAATAVVALLADAHQEFSSSFISGLSTVFERQQGELFTDRERLNSAVDLGGKGSALEEQVVECVNRKFDHEGRNHGAMLRAVEEVLSERIEARDRAMTGHWLKCGDAQARAAIQEMKSAIRTINIKDIAAQIIDQHRPLTPNTSTAQLDLDEELRSSK